MDEPQGIALGPKLRLNKHIIERCLRYHDPEKIVAHFARIGYSQPACWLMIYRVRGEQEKRRQKLERKTQGVVNELFPGSGIDQARQ